MVPKVPHLSRPPVPPVSHTKHPGDGFYQYVNYSWLKTHHIRSWDSEYSVSDEIQDATDKELLRLLEKPTPTLSKIITLWSNRKVEKEEAFIRIGLHELVSTNPSDIARFFGWMCKSRIRTLIQLVGQEEIVSPWHTRISLTPGTLTLPVKYYLSPELNTTDIWKAYVSYIGTVSVELGLPFLYEAIQGEIDLAKALDLPFTTVAKGVKGRNLRRWCPEFEWEAFMDGLNIGAWQKQLWLLDSPERLKRILSWICTAPTERVVAVLALHFISFGAPYLRPAIHHATDALVNKALHGITQEAPEKYHLLNDLKKSVPEELCALYAKSQHDDTKIREIRRLVKSLREAAIHVMSETTVLSKRTVSAAKEKIRRMRFTIGSVPSVASRKDETTYSDSLLHTIVSMQHGRVDRLHSSIGKPSETIDDYPCYIANASYFEESNQIVLPWGILQSPFVVFESAESIGWNYGGIGATIAHEMTHAFDLEGSQYSPRATFREWWTRKDRVHFKQRTRKVGKFFSRFKHYGVPLDGMKTLSEDWADLGGITISLRALKQQATDLSAEKQKEVYRQFFISYASSWRGLIRKKQMIYAIMTSVHAPGEDRVDRIVPHFQEWVDAFDIKESDALYVPPEKRLKFF